MRLRYTNQESKSQRNNRYNSSQFQNKCFAPKFITRCCSQTVAPVTMVCFQMWVVVAVTLQEFFLRLVLVVKVPNCLSVDESHSEIKDTISLKIVNFHLRQNVSQRRTTSTVQNTKTFSSPSCTTKRSIKQLKPATFWNFFLKLLFNYQNSC